MEQTKQELEACVAACVLIEKGANVMHVDVELEDFELPEAKAVIGAARELQTVDLLLARDWGRQNNISTTAADISEIVGLLPTSARFMLYLQRLKAAIYQEKISKYRLSVAAKLKAGADLIDLAKEIETEEAALSAKYLQEKHSASLVDASSALICRIKDKIDNDGLISTGWPALDSLFGGGLLPNELVIIAARPSGGKTAAALQIALDCNQRVVLFSLEMSLEQISPRLLSAIALQNTKIAARRPSQISEETRKRLLCSNVDLLQASERIIIYDQHSQTIESIRRCARKEVEAGAKIVILDYLQLLDKKAESRERAVSQISRELKNMAKELNTPVICLAQMNRQAEADNRPPRLSDLRESGAIEQDANAVLFIHHDKTTPASSGCKKVQLLLAKGRDVGTGIKYQIFNTDHQRFYEIDPR